jgi:hypothetical protein
MAILGRVFLVLILGAFPMGIYFFAKADKKPEAPLDAKLAAKEISKTPPTQITGEALDLINKGIESKAREIKEINVQILENRGKILRLEDERQNKLKILEDLQIKLSTIIKEASPEKSISVQ